MWLLVMVLWTVVALPAAIVLQIGAWDTLMTLLIAGEIAFACELRNPRQRNPRQKGPTDGRDND